MKYLECVLKQLDYSFSLGDGQLDRASLTFRW